MLKRESLLNQLGLSVILHNYKKNNCKCSCMLTAVAQVSGWNYSYRVFSSQLTDTNTTQMGHVYGNLGSHQSLIQKASLSNNTASLCIS